MHLTNGTLYSCSPKTYNFNDGTQQGFFSHPTYTPSSLGVSTAIKRGSTGASLAFGINLTPSSSTFRTSVQLEFCPSGYVNMVDKTISVWVYIAGPAFPSCGGGDHTFGMNVSGSRGSGFPAVVDNPSLNTWFQVTGTITSDTYSSAHTVDFSMYINCVPTWSGTVYIDDVVING
jgi:hypothetical protein